MPQSISPPAVADNQRPETGLHAAPNLVRVGRRAVAAASIGNALEWYDFSIYAFFAIYFANNFFIRADSGTRLLEAFLAFGLGYVIRPLGALVLGSYGDRAGRKAALTMTISIMALGTLVIAVAPTYAAIGVGAPILIVCGRLLQGFSAGGEVGGAAAFLVEHAPPEKKGKYASWLQASMGITNILAALVATIVTMSFTSEQINDWAWRIPFLLGLSILPVGLWLRRTLHETPAFEAEKLRQQHDGCTERAPLLQVVRDYPRQLLAGVGLSILWVVSVYVLIIFLPTHAQRAWHFTGAQAFRASLVGNCLLVGGCVFAGTLSDRFGRARVLTTAALLLLVTVYPALMWLDAARTPMVLIIVQSLLCVLVSLFSGVAPSALSEVFPTRVRATGMSVAYNTASAVFGGFAPAILTWLYNETGSPFAPAWYVMAAALIGLFAVGRIDKLRPKAPVSA
ncbi:MFS transporter [Paraburkholderia susongensis]|uniref:MFS transporter, MHS family, proline/betaine transporter n=1 Tax=Paraburkholderia susongensis TaxID=1515439 RepID=A0A1X7M0P5_9BURK|nr:MFS transporter [Paraburkholderia susongensis]SMG59093.1 MFS transporter, MHS family, proline/betaine transporter [Paraburkholderia susongensis]